MLCKWLSLTESQLHEIVVLSHSELAINASACDELYRCSKLLHRRLTASASHMPSGFSP